MRFGAVPKGILAERKGERGLSTVVVRGLDEARSEICVVMDGI
jgi:hypothetical protein